MWAAAVSCMAVALSLASKATILHQISINRRRRSVEGVSVPFFVVGMLSYDLYTLSGILGHNWPLVLGMSPGGILSLLVLLQVYRYR